MNRGKMNYWVDVGIGIAGLLSAVSGLVFLLPGDPTTGVLGVSYQAWSSLHTWSSLAVIAGVGAHVVLHWKWMLAMTKHLFPPAKPRQSGEAVAEITRAATTGDLSRRAFLALGGAATLLAGAVVVGYRAISANAAGEAAETSLRGSQAAATGQEGVVACPHGLTNDPYPGRCRFYVDTDGDGICDYSVPGSGSMVASTNSWGSYTGGVRRRPRAGQQ